MDCVNSSTRLDEEAATPHATIGNFGVMQGVQRRLPATVAFQWPPLRVYQHDKLGWLDQYTRVNLNPKSLVLSA